MVTSSAVVGSSAIKQLRLAGERHRDHHALAHAAGEPVRVVVEALFGRRDMHAAQHLERQRLAPSARWPADGGTMPSTI